MVTQIRSALTLLLVIVNLGLPGCGFIPFYAQGQIFSPGIIAALEKGRSTKFDVLRLFGEPLERNAADLYEANEWRYHYEYLGILGVERAELEFTFQDYVLEDYQKKVRKSRY
jgi:hypothetical protein